MEDTTNPTPETEDAPDRMEEFCQSFVDSITLFMDTVEATGADVERLFGFVDSFNVGMQKLREVHRQEDFKFQREQGKVIAELIEAGIPEDIINRLVFGDPDSKTESINETLMA